MSAVKQKDTGPEKLVRRLLHRLGYRFRLHRKDLPGRPDIVFSPRKKVIFVHGCFWHGHGCSKGQLPKSKLEYWAPKISSNKERDKKQIMQLKKLGWKVCVVWQCEIEFTEELQQKLKEFIGTTISDSNV